MRFVVRSQFNAYDGDARVHRRIHQQQQTLLLNKRAEQTFLNE